MLRFSKFVAAAVVAVASTMTAQAQSATRPFTIGVAAGAAIPTGDLSNDTNTGYNVTGLIGLSSPTFPVGLRLEAGYSSFGVKSSSLSGSGVSDANTRAIGFTGNLVVPFPMQNSAIQPYIIGGAGIYNVKVSASASGVSASASENDFGFNGGAGLKIPLSGVQAFVEARYHHVSISGNSSASYVPITFGLTF